jgi:hypothetical protein
MAAVTMSPVHKKMHQRARKEEQVQTGTLEARAE